MGSEAAAIAVPDGPPTPTPKRVPLRGLARVASVALGVQFGWALQTSLLTPYVQELGIPHEYAGYIWLCGPISGMFVQPIAGYYSDRCQLKWGRRRPFILGGAIFVVLAIFVISFAADLGFLLGDNKHHRPRAIVFFVIGFWLLDLANNTLQGPCRALLADLSGKDYRRTRRANAFFSLFLSIGNVLGYAAGSYSNWPKVFPFTRSEACDKSCANLKSAFIIDVLLLVITTVLSITAADEVPWSPLSSNSRAPLLQDPAHAGSVNGEQGEQGAEEEGEPPLEKNEAFFWELIGTVRHLPREMWCILLVTAMTWISWYPFWLFNTDWMGREVFKGEPSSKTAKQYDRGVRLGSFGLMLNSIVLGLASVVMEPLCRKFKAKNVWSIANFIMAACFSTAVAVSIVMKNAPVGRPSLGVQIASLLFFTVLGAPLAVTYSIPFALTAAVAGSSGGGQGLYVGVLNLAIVIPQFLTSIFIGPWDTLFGGGDMPAFTLSAVVALLSSLIAPYILPKPPAELRSSKLRRTISAPIP
ncbi:sucrose transport protein SUT2 [Selaginella moellendorffii]|uniref:sucrose transport protein SUT2 n=1 Tax=Selaginella moellendorffii TaxID=88036 RepID=UPI000D1D0251|nr:sucrose transport protein SUT2 [Selaginella moellendorffii]|eukprot:XP_024534366.1 sucrose transport protein SUT2 [Selaginella moellendorffii]